MSRSPPIPRHSIPHARVHVVLSVKDLGRSASFYIDALGLVESAREKDALYLRGVEEACHHSLVLRQASTAPAAQKSVFVHSRSKISSKPPFFFAQKDCIASGLRCLTKGGPSMSQIRSERRSNIALRWKPRNGWL